jgi:DNA-binding CsgD family transcriptional regulator/PAS domain-containing protein
MIEEIASIAAFSELVGLIYDCALDPALWPEAIRGICVATSCTAGALDVRDMNTGATRIQQHWNISPEFLERMLQYGPEIAEIVSTVPDLYTRPLDEPLWVTRDVPAMFSSRYYHEWIKPQRIVDAIQLNMLRQRDRFGSLALSRHEHVGIASERDLAICRLLAPHIRRAVTVSNALDMQAVTLSTFEASLDLIATGVVLVDADARIVHANRAAQAMLQAGSPIRSDRGELRALMPETTTALRAAIARAAGSEAAIGGAGIGVPAPQADGAPSLIHVLPLMSGDVRARIAPRAIAALFITPAVDGIGAPPAALAALFDLSPAEMRTLDRLVAGDTLAEAAQALGVALATVRTHLAHIFEKTGTSRQAELIRLAAKFAPPIVVPGA